MREEREEGRVDYIPGCSAIADVQAAEGHHANAHLLINLDAESKLGLLLPSNEAKKKTLLRYFYSPTIDNTRRTHFPATQTQCLLPNDLHTRVHSYLSLSQTTLNLRNTGQHSIFSDSFFTIEEHIPAPLCYRTQSAFFTSSCVPTPAVISFLSHYKSVPHVANYIPQKSAELLSLIYSTRKQPLSAEIKVAGAVGRPSQATALAKVKLWPILL